MRQNEEIESIGRSEERPSQATGYERFILKRSWSRVQIAGKEVLGEFESECLGLCGAWDTFHAGTLKWIARVYRQTFIDT